MTPLLPVQFFPLLQSSSELPNTPKTRSILRPTPQINLDLSLLVALASDLTHYPLVSDEQEAFERFNALSRKEREQLRVAEEEGSGGVSERQEAGNTPNDRGEISAGLGEHARSLSAQALSESRRGLLEEMHEHCLPLPSSSSSSSPSPSVCFHEHSVRFWTTAEAHRRFEAIIDKIGGEREKRRASAMFLALPPSNTSTDAVGGVLGGEESGRDAGTTLIARFWEGSRYPEGFIPGLVPILVLPELAANHTSGSSPPQDHRSADQIRSADPPLAPGHGGDTFRTRIETTSAILLDSFSRPRPFSFSDPDDARDDRSSRIGITPHTVASFLAGTAELSHPLLLSPSPGSLGFPPYASAVRKPGCATFMTTLTANRASIKTLIRHVNRLFPHPIPHQSYEDAEGVIDSRSIDKLDWAVLWVVEPRSLAEGMMNPSSL